MALASLLFSTKAGGAAGRIFLRKVYGFMAVALAATGGAAYAGERFGVYPLLEKVPALLPVALAAPIVLLLLSYRIERMGRAAAHLAFWSCALLLGFSLSGIFEVYAGTSIARTFFATGAAFAVTSAYSAATRTDLTRLGSLLLMGLVGVLLVGLANLLFTSSLLQITIELAGVILFAALTAYDTQHILELGRNSRGRVSEKMAIIGALTLYLDFINLFVSLLQFRRLGFSLPRYAHRMAAWSRLFVESEPRPKPSWRRSALGILRWARARIAPRGTRRMQDHGR
jgi:FtsH-binding integral membrane protein